MFDKSLYPELTEEKIMDMPEELKSVSRNDPAPAEPINCELRSPNMQKVYELWIQMGKLYGSCEVCGSRDNLSAHPYVESKVNLTVDNRYMLCPNCNMDKRTVDFKRAKKHAEFIGGLINKEAAMKIRTLCVALRRNVSLTDIM